MRNEEKAVQTVQEQVNDKALSLITLSPQEQYIANELKKYQIEKAKNIDNVKMILEQISVDGVASNIAIARSVYIASTMPLKYNGKEYKSLYEALKGSVVKDGKVLGRSSIYDYAKYGEFIDFEGKDTLPRTIFKTKAFNDKNEIIEVDTVRHNFTYSQLKLIVNTFGKDNDHKTMIEQMNNFAKNYKLVEIPTTKEFEKLLKSYAVVKDEKGDKLEISKDTEQIYNAFITKQEKVEKEQKEKEKVDFIKNSHYYKTIEKALFDYLNTNSQVISSGRSVQDIIKDIAKTIKE